MSLRMQLQYQFYLQYEDYFFSRYLRLCNTILCREAYEINIVQVIKRQLIVVILHFSAGWSLLATVFADNWAITGCPRFIVRREECVKHEWHVMFRIIHYFQSIFNCLAIIGLSSIFFSRVTHDLWLCYIW